MARLLRFEIGPDANATGGAGHTGSAQCWLNGTSLGIFTTPAESGDDGIREWGLQTVDVSALVAVGSNLFEAAYNAGPDTVTFRLVRIEDDVSGEEWFDQYEHFPYPSQIDGVALTSSVLPRQRQRFAIPGGWMVGIAIAGGGGWTGFEDAGPRTQHSIVVD